MWRREGRLGSGKELGPWAPSVTPALPEPQVTMSVNKPESHVHHVYAGPGGLEFGLDLLVCLSVIHGHGVEPSELSVKSDSQKSSPPLPLLSH